ncbi:SRPBCC domain-containing protein [Halorarius halobius]|uniref:SRPBCC domain-containing protein n=1 Tax=Halorarius halobius TaxID=2962671 RepID=UPI0020CDAA6C|nr:SRPBCC domain-containing protein [Halorarius halobius]
MHELETAIDIDAPADVVWAVLTDFDAYPEWNRYTRVDGEAVAGTTLEVAPGPDANRVPTFRPEILRADGGELRWLGHLIVPGLFDGEHRFVVEPLDGDRSRLVQSEQFRGLLVRPVLWYAGADTEATFEAVNRAVKARAEALAADIGGDGPRGDRAPAA